jgi:tryptophan 2,3-dioxygenase
VQEWRYRHAVLASRLIGDLPGTGGTTGVGYLRNSLGRPVFADLWAARVAG